MTPHHQLVTEYRNDEGVYGDCGRTVIACLMDMHPSEVPHFFNMPDEGDADAAYDAEKTSGQTTR